MSHNSTTTVNSNSVVEGACYRQRWFQDHVGQDQDRDQQPQDQDQQCQDKDQDQQPQDQDRIFQDQHKDQIYKDWYKTDLYYCNSCVNSINRFDKIK